MGYAVLTRDPADAQAYVAVLAPLGLEVVAMPVTHSAPAEDPDALAAALRDRDVAVIVVASPRAAHELARAGRAIGVERWPDVWAVGPATRRALEIAKIAARHPEGVSDGAGLARALVANRAVSGLRVLVPRAEEGRSEARDILGAAGADVIDVIAYRTVATPAGDPALAPGRERLVGKTADVCAVFAPSQVAALAGIVGALEHLSAAFCAIGETTAAALRAHGVKSIAVAAEPSPAGMAQAVRSVYPRR